MHVNKHLQMEMQPHIFVAGDIALIDEEKLVLSSASFRIVSVTYRRPSRLHLRATLWLLISCGSLKINPCAHMNQDRYQLLYLSANSMVTFSPPTLVVLSCLGIFIYNQLSFSGFIPALLKDAVEWLELVHMY